MATPLANLAPVLYHTFSPKGRERMKILAAAYARYSTSLQHETSIAAQLKAIDDFCRRNDLTLSGMPYIDEAKTGTNMRREGMENLRRDAHAGKFKAIVIYDISRGSRNLEDWLSFRREMDKLGIKLYSVTSSIGDLDKPADFLNETVQAAVGQFYVLQSRQKSIEGKAVRAERGLFCGGVAPLGYDIKDGRYIINEREAPVVRMIFDMYAAGRSYGEIMEEIKKTGITGKHGKMIVPNTLYYILKNERYTGTFVWNEYEMRHMHEWVGRKNADDEVTRIEGAIPEIVPRPTWEIVRSRMEANRHNAMNNSRRGTNYYLLSGVIRCGECNGPLSGVTSTSKGIEYKRYTCINKRKSRSCNAKDIRAERLERYIVDFLRERILVPDVIAKMADRIIAYMRSSDEGSVVRAELASIAKKTANLFAAVESGLTTPEVVERLNEYAERKRALEARLAKIPAAAEIDRGALIAVLMADIEKSYDDPRACKELVGRYIQSVTLYSDHIHLEVLPNLVRYTSSRKQKKFTNPCELVNGAGSPGRARTYNNSVNSRVLCH